MSLLNLVSYNIENGRKVEEILKNISDLKASGANIFCLQEVRPATDGKFIGDQILELLGPAWRGEFFLTQSKSYADNGLGIFWNQELLTLEKAETLSFTKLNKLVVHEQVFEYVKGSRVLKPIARGTLIGTFSVQGKTVRIANVHFDWHGWSRHRGRQLEELLAYIKKSPVDREIICGDFNTIGFFGFGRKLHMIEALLGAEFASCFPKYVTTTTHFQQLDHCFVRNLKILAAKVLELPGSDHYPINITLEAN